MPQETEVQVSMSSLEVNESPFTKAYSRMCISLWLQFISYTWFPCLQRESGGAHPLVLPAFLGLRMENGDW